MKKFIGIAVGCCMALSSFCVSASDGGFKEDVLKLISYDIMSESTVSMAETETVTRGQMMQYVINAMLLGGVQPTADTTVFSDVDSNHPNHDAIYLAHELGIVDGNGDGTFCPDEAVTYGQAAKILMNMLGYNPMAEQRGGYPAGYIKLAADAGVTEGITFEQADKVSLADVADMMCKAVQTPVMEQTSYGSDAVYTTMNGKNGTLLVTMEMQYDAYNSDNK